MTEKNNEKTFPFTPSPLAETTVGPSTRLISKKERDELILKVYHLAMEGLTNREISNRLLIKESTLQLWKRKLRAAGHNLPILNGRRSLGLPKIETAQSTTNETSLN